MKTDFPFYLYIDSFQCSFLAGTKNITSDVVTKYFLQSAPRWSSRLFALRDYLVKLVGLKTSGMDGDRLRFMSNNNLKLGGGLGLFKVLHKTKSEIVMGENDKHLDFRVSVLIQDIPEKRLKKLTITTIVKFNSWFGHVYFFLVKPFHRLIVVTMMKNTVKTIESL